MTPALPQLGSFLPWLDLLGIAVFAASGALAARDKGDVVTAAFFALVTGVGGGTLRDLLIGAPVWWVHHPFVAALCLGVAVLVWFTPTHLWSPKALDWLDALGLAAYAVFGTAKALSLGIPPVPAALMGVLTACAGGILRDVLAGVPSSLLRPELYVTPAVLTAGLHVALTLLGLPVLGAALVAATAGFALRGAAMLWNIHLPRYGPRRR